MLSLCLVKPPSASAQEATQPAGKVAASPVRLIDVTRIWDAAPHCAFTDLVRFKGQWYCTFREGPKHVSEEASIRVLRSRDGKKWASAALIAQPTVDLRDSKLSIMPDGRLMLLGGARQWPPKYERRLWSWVAFSADGTTWTQPQRVLDEGMWLWRLTWHDKVGYGIAYLPTLDGKNREGYFSRLYRTTDGLQYEQVAEFTGYPGLSEATLRFGDDGTMYCLHRRDAGTKTALLGVSKPPYTRWTWKDSGHYFGGPNFVVCGGQWWAAGRWLDSGPAKTVLARADFERGTLEPVLDLPSGGDTSYPGMVVEDGTLWMSYYSSHAAKTAIYLARIDLKAASSRPAE